MGCIISFFPFLQKVHMQQFLEWSDKATSVQTQLMMDMCKMLEDTLCPCNPESSFKNTGSTLVLLGITNLHMGPASAQVVWRSLCFKLIRMLKVRPKKHNLWTLYSMGETSQTANTVHDLSWTCVSNLIRCCSKLTASWPTSCWTEILFLGEWPQTKFLRCWWGTSCHVRGEHSTPWLQIFSEHALKQNYNDWNILT